MRKAFDVINHEILLSKLKIAGVTEITHKWFESYLEHRKQYVVCKGSSSDILNLCYGVPQGSALGPSLFSIHYDGVKSSVEFSNCTLSADDTEIHSSDPSAIHAANCVNKNLKNVSNWLTQNQMVPHPGKSVAMKIGSRPALRRSHDIDIRFDDRHLKEVSTVKYLGIHMDSALTWMQHQDYICKKIYPKLRLLNRRTGVGQ